MPEPDFEGARQYALKRLERELSPWLCYHSLAHTRDDVVAAAARLAEMEGLSAADLHLLMTAAYFHDIGYVEQQQDHEAAGARIVQLVLPGFGYSAAQVATITALLLATRLPQSPRTLAEQLLCDADLDVLGRPDYWRRSRDLRAELEHFGPRVTDEAWLQGQLQFLRGHTYFSRSARALRGTQKHANLLRLVELLTGRARPITQGSR